MYSCPCLSSIYLPWWLHITNDLLECPALLMRNADAHACMMMLLAKFPTCLPAKPHYNSPLVGCSMTKGTGRHATHKLPPLRAGAAPANLTLNIRPCSPVGQDGRAGRSTEWHCQYVIQERVETARGLRTCVLV